MKDRNKLANQHNKWGKEEQVFEELSEKTGPSDHLPVPPGKKEDSSLSFAHRTSQSSSRQGLTKLPQLDLTEITL